ncbi:MAG: hypothetical protein PCFJNLEI_02574 [Verrucomicrobiae bacterium]|nr:hypothetical protein [Verrucomicrobiae bacterium]
MSILFRILFLTGLGLLAGCATPIGVNHVGMKRAYEQITANTLTGPELSADTKLVLARYDLARLQRYAPDVAIAKLHAVACQETRRDVLFALAEISYAASVSYAEVTWATVHGQANQVTAPGQRVARAYGFASAVYAYLYLFGEGMEAPPDPFDRRFRLACDFYNRGLASALKEEAGDNVDLQARTLRLPMGSVRVESTRPGFPWTAAQFHEFVAADEYFVRGLDQRSREPGLGVPLIAIPDRAAFGAQWPRYYPTGLKVPATAFLRVKGTVCDMAGNGLQATLELYSAYTVHEVEVGNRRVPLETDLTAPLAYSLQKSIMWSAAIAQLLSGQQLIPTGVYLPQPYEPGKIPVVFVHGTASSPVGWAPMFNTLQADPALRARYQLWYFIYNTGNPIAYSGALLREGLAAIIREIDPAGQDPALQNMVVIGHSQGGLLTKLTAVRSGDQFWQNITTKPFAEVTMPASERDLLRRALFVEPSPSVRRVIFISTPHGGARQINNLVQNLSQRLFTMPQQLTGLAMSLAKLDNPLMKRLHGKVPTSIANMKADNPFLMTLRSLPVNDGIRSHSIIAVKGRGPVETGFDGIVAYQSAHLDGVQSEFVVRDGHSCQANPLTIEEVRRILLEHAAGSGRTATGVNPPSAPIVPSIEVD